jgi:hypothetical protein
MSAIEYVQAQDEEQNCVVLMKRKLRLVMQLDDPLLLQQQGDRTFDAFWNEMQHVDACVFIARVVNHHPTITARDTSWSLGVATLMPENQTIVLEIEEFKKFVPSDGDLLRVSTMVLERRNAPYTSLNDMHKHPIKVLLRCCRERCIDVQGLVERSEVVKRLEDHVFAVRNMGRLLSKLGVGAHNMTQSQMKQAILDYESKPCNICLEQYETSDDVVTLKCGHTFHTTCMQEWAKSEFSSKRATPSCPTCRVAIDDDSPVVDHSMMLWSKHESDVLCGWLHSSRPYEEGTSLPKRHRKQ